MAMSSVSSASLLPSVSASFDAQAAQRTALLKQGGLSTTLSQDTSTQTSSQTSSQTAEDAQRAAEEKAAARQASKELTPEQLREVERLKQIDREVRAHEQAHLSAGFGVVTSGPSYTYTYGPDKKQYATAGEVGIDTSAEKKPQANVDKGQRIQAAALAPAEPSPQDHRVAAIGRQLEIQGRADLAREQRAQSYARQEAGPSVGAHVDTFV